MTSVNRTVKEMLAESIREEIIAGNYHPGQKLLQNELAERFQVSSIPVREALRYLEAEGLVTVMSRKGAIVTKLTAEDMEDIYGMRLVLEDMAVRAAVPLIDEQALTEMESYTAKMDSPLLNLVEWIELNNSFHTTLYAASQRTYLCDIIRLLRQRIGHYYHAFMSQSGTKVKGQEEHRAIIKACRTNDVEMAAEITRKHLITAANNLIANIKRNQ